VIRSAQDCSRRGDVARPRTVTPFTISDRLQHATCASAEQIGYDTRYRDMRFLEERLQPIVELHAARVI
jgi:hypothetical protein